MPLAKNFVGSGFSGQQAIALTSSVVALTVAAAGTTQGTATAATADYNFVTSGGDGAGVILYDGQIGDSQEFFNSQLTNLRIYPPTGDKINQIATNGCIIVPAYTYVLCKKLSSTQWGELMSA